MTEEQLHQIHHNYRSVCDAPMGDSLHIQRMPHFLLTDTNDNNSGHVHTFYEIIWFQEEGGTHTVDFQDYEVHKNSLFFLSPGQVHHFDGKTMHKGVLIQFCTDFMRDEQASEDIFLKYDVFNAQSSPCCQVTDEVAALRLAQLVAQMEAELLERKAFAHTDMLRSLVRQFLILVYRHGQCEKSLKLDAKRPVHRLYAQFRQLVEREYMHLHTVSEYAQRLNVSVRTLSLSVHECAATTPLVMINNRITLEAKRLLRYSPMIVKQVAQHLGYDDVSYFVKFFKRQTGVLPKEFREAEIE